MPCACTQCQHHAATLGIAGLGPADAQPSGNDGSEKALISEERLHRAYRAAAMRWHPDRFGHDPQQQLAAAEHFKLIQVAYRELVDHHRRPAILAPELTFTKPEPPPPFSFGNAPGCFVAPHFPPEVYRLIANHLGAGHKPLGVIDLTRPGAPSGPFAQFLLLEANSLIVRGTLGIVSLLWYAELGDLTLVDRRVGGRLTLWQRFLESLTGPRPNYTLQIFRRNGKHFYSLAGEVDDGVKRVVYNFLLRMKSQQPR